MSHRVLFLTFHDGVLVDEGPSFKNPPAGHSVIRVEFGSDGKALSSAPVPSGGGWEPTFTLRAQDELAAPVVSLWADIAQRCGVPMAKVVSARSIAKAMLEWSGPVKKAD